MDFVCNLWIEKRNVRIFMDKQQSVHTFIDSTSFLTLSWVIFLLLSTLPSLHNEGIF